jgi:2-hydroxychromene-2-carboxylate isomerase
MLQEGGAADAAAPLKAAIFNIGANVNLPLLETTERVFRKDATVKERLLRNTEQSVARGTFGAPMFWSAI